MKGKISFVFILFIPLILIWIFVFYFFYHKYLSSKNIKMKNVKNLVINALDFENNWFIPSKFTCEGEDLFPTLKITGLTDEKTFAIIVDDPDAPIWTFTHLIVWNLPVVNQIDSSVLNQWVFGKNDFGKLTWNGPCPPVWHGVHHYYFKVYGLDSMVDLRHWASKEDLLQAMSWHIVSYGEIVGKYER